MQGGQYQSSYSRNRFMARGSVKNQAIRILLIMAVCTGAPYLVIFFSKTAHGLYILLSFPWNDD